MKVSDIVKDLKLEIKTEKGNMEAEVKGGYSSDLLSDVVANCHEGYVWITLQIHQNIVAVATMKDISAVILVNNRQPDADTIKKANEYKINILVSDLPAFEIAGRLHGKGLKGS